MAENLHVSTLQDAPVNAPVAYLNDPRYLVGNAQLQADTATSALWTLDRLVVDGALNDAEDGSLDVDAFHTYMLGIIATVSEASDSAAKALKVHQLSCDDGADRADEGELVETAFDISSRLRSAFDSMEDAQAMMEGVRRVVGRVDSLVPTLDDLDDDDRERLDDVMGSTIDALDEALDKAVGAAHWLDEAQDAFRRA